MEDKTTTERQILKTLMDDYYDLIETRGWKPYTNAKSVAMNLGGCKSLTQVGYLFYVLQNFQRAIKFQTTSWSII